MASSQFLTNAIQCVKNLQKTNIPDDLAFSIPTNTSLASSMTALSHNARHIQHIVEGNENLADIEIVVACKVEKRRGRSSRVKTKNFVLWSTMLSQTNFTPENDMATDQSAKTHLVQGQQSLETTGTHRGPPLAHGRSHYTSTPTATQQQPSSHGHPHGNADNDSDWEVKCSVSVTTATKCLKLLLNGSGFSSHKGCLEQGTYKKLGSKILEDAVRKVFEHEKELRKSVERNSQPSTRNKHEMIYLDLLPDHLRKKDERKQVSVSFPAVSLEYDGIPKVSETMKVSLEIKKPDRNTKSQNFALLWTLLHETGLSGTCARVLRAYAREGLSEMGCKRRMRFCTASSSKCGGFDKCKYSKRMLCRFYRKIDEPPLGQGRVDPFTRHVNGELVPNDFIAVRFGNVTEERDPSRGMVENNERHERDTAEQLKDPTVWNRKLIGRITLFGDYEKVLGSAILVEDHIPIGVHESIAKRMMSLSRKKGGVDVSHAVVICDVELTEETQSSEQKYPYAEWYDVPCLRILKKMHFRQAVVPKHMNKYSLNGSIALLWHKDYLKPDETRTTEETNQPIQSEASEQPTQNKVS